MGERLDLGRQVAGHIVQHSALRSSPKKPIPHPLQVTRARTQGRRLHPLDKGGQGIHSRGLGTKVVPELVFNAWAGVRRCGSLFFDLDSLKR